ncbi:MAG: tetratricopeptide repeat protein [Chloroflexota bacterium]
MKKSAAPTSGRKIDMLQENLSTLYDELELAGNYHRPSILLAAYRSRLVLLDAQVWLKTKLQKLKQKVFQVNVSQENWDIPLYLSSLADRDDHVFFVSGLMNGGGNAGMNAYRALNMRRELLVDHHIRAVFWLTENEANILPTQAGDFWAFRHRMVEFFDKPKAIRMTALVKRLNLAKKNEQELLQEIPDGLLLREELLNEMPDWKKSPELRAELILEMSAIHAAHGDYAKARKLLQAGLDIAKKDTVIALEPRLWNALGTIEQRIGSYEQAVTSYQNSLRLDPKMADSWNRLGSTFFILRKPGEALNALKKAIELDPKSPSPWKNLGDLCMQNNKMDDAILAYKKTLAIDPANQLIWEKLGDLYLSQSKIKEALSAFKKAKRLDINNPSIWVKLGTAHSSLKQNNFAIRAFYKASRLQPDDASLWKKLGDIYRSARQTVYARKAYKAALELDPLDEMTITSLNLCYKRAAKKRPVGNPKLPSLQNK